MSIGRIDIHSHLLPGVDDGSTSPAESFAMARGLVEHGYTHSFCTPHIWPSFPHNNLRQIAAGVRQLQAGLDEQGIPLKLFPGGELNLREDLSSTQLDDLVSYAELRRFVLIDLWADELPAYFEPVMKWLQSTGATVILAHPERMATVQRDPSLADMFDDLGLLLQGNLYCLDDPIGSPTRTVAEQFLQTGRYFALASDLHRPEGLPTRMRGLQRAIDLVGDEVVDQLTRHNPRQLLPDA